MRENNTANSTNKSNIRRLLSQDTGRDNSQLDNIYLTKPDFSALIEKLKRQS